MCGGVHPLTQRGQLGVHPSPRPVGAAQRAVRGQPEGEFLLTRAADAGTIVLAVLGVLIAVVTALS